jgi:hypothetical protein
LPTVRDAPKCGRGSPAHCEEAQQEFGMRMRGPMTVIKVAESPVP